MILLSKCCHIYRESGRLPIYVIAALIILCAACDLTPPSSVQQLSGVTMGTYYTVQLVEQMGVDDLDLLQQGVERILASINQSMSTYLETSELSNINSSRSEDWINISEDLFIVLQEALWISRLSAGAFDITIGPLVNLWGFGPAEKITKIPDPQLIAQLRDQLGYAQLAIRAQPFAMKKASTINYIDLSAIAKGYAVDKIAAYLSKRGMQHFLVDIGGEIKAQGQHANGELWRIGIEDPLAGKSQLGQIIALQDMGVATSGDYRNYIEIAGTRYSHTIDPKTGYPVTHTLSEVTVLNRSVMRADGLATALLVMGPAQGMLFAAEHSIAARFALRTEAGLLTCQTAAFAKSTNASTTQLPLCIDMLAHGS